MDQQMELLWMQQGLQWLLSVQLRVLQQQLREQRMEQGLHWEVLGWIQWEPQCWLYWEVLGWMELEPQSWLYWEVLGWIQWEPQCWLSGLKQYLLSTPRSSCTAEDRARHSFFPEE